MEFAIGSYSKFNAFTRILRLLVTVEDLDAFTGVSGFKGFGKSSFSIGCCKRIVENYMGENYGVKAVGKYTAYSNQDVQDKVRDLPDYSPLACDEAVNFALGEDWMKSENKELKKVLTKIRTKHLMLFFNIPDLFWLDTKYRENMMGIWIDIVRKGYCTLNFPNLSPGLEDHWMRDWLKKEFKGIHWSYFQGFDRGMKKLQSYPCYYDQFPFPKLPQDLYAEHLRLREDQIFSAPKKERDFKQELKLPVYNAYINQDLFKKIIQENDGRKLTLNEILDFFYKDPVTNRTLLARSTARKWIDQIQEQLKGAAGLKPPLLL